ncbi:DUF1918 domain-containing protein [Streptomyces broussonetiae]|uniref:DUF1918 domain-containing protein n=1 Tax=Streptomyces broussonetiae TaxID=2686304 RepID=A0A6I6MXI8_9ACTN|nr:DUF1918 domain-containing protein [Streptomyces broussonetiae]QHA02951.1 DUF1918 domain-containing protein [Streptomyces broussonetiae]
MSAPAPPTETGRDAPEAAGVQMRARVGDDRSVRRVTAGVIARVGEIVPDSRVGRPTPAPQHPERTCFVRELTTGGGHVPAR